MQRNFIIYAWKSESLDINIGTLKATNVIWTMQFKASPTPFSALKQAMIAQAVIDVKLPTTAK